jgi:uncharacterized protein YbaR (Trm112 family)
MTKQLPPEARPYKLDGGVLELLACPACAGDLRLQGNALLCAACGRSFPVIDGIAVLIPPAPAN